MFLPYKDKAVIKMTPQEIQNKITSPLSDDDLKYYLGADINKQIITFSDLDNYLSIDDLLPKDRSYKIILIEEEKNRGHWVAIMKYNNTVEYFNSYGTKPTNDLNFVSSIKNKLLGQSKDLIKKILDDSLTKGYKVIYNTKRMQKIGPNINTCGRHIVCRLVAMTKLFYDLQEYINYIDQFKKKYNVDSDEVVAILI
jgi:hypothetical protein